MWLTFLLLAAIILISFFMGYGDGYLKLHKTTNHLAKWPIYLSLYVVARFAIGDTALLLGWALMFKPLFDIGWSAGAGYDYIFIGTTSWLDKILQPLAKIEHYGKFPALTTLYFILIVGGSFLFIHFTRFSF